MMRIELGVALSVAVAAAACASESGPVVAPAPAQSAALAAVEVDRTVDCPGLAKVKYPFLTCVMDEAGNVVFDAAPEPMTVSQMPPMDSFLDDESFWGR